MKPIFPIIVGLALAALLAPTVMNAQDYWDESYVEYTDHDLWTVRVSGYSCTYQPYSYEFGLEADSSLYGGNSGEIAYEYLYKPCYEYPYRACAYVEATAERGQAFAVYGHHYWYYYESEWYYDTSYYPTDYVPELGPPEGETSFVIQWHPHVNYSGWDSAGGEFEAELYPDGYNYAGFRVEESLVGWFDECNYSDNSGPAMPMATPWGWWVEYDGSYRTDFITAPYDDWIDYYSYQIAQSNLYPCWCSCFQEMWIRDPYYWDFVWYAESWTDVYLDWNYQGSATRGQAQVGGAVSP